MKKILVILVTLTSTVLHLQAGGLVTNSNQSATYYRMLARGASMSGDAVYYNPGGLAFLDDGLTISLNSQTIWMQRTLTNDLATLNNPEFIGKLFVPVFPGIYAAYKKSNWTFSLGFNPPAGGGSVEFADGLPMLENTVSLIPSVLNIPNVGLTTTGYETKGMLKGSSIAYGIQAGATYKINDKIGVFGGVRMLLASNSYEGYLTDIKFNPSAPALAAYGIAADGTMRSAPEFLNAMGGLLETMGDNANAAAMRALAAGTGDQFLDAKQKGNGLAPILGVHFNLDKLNLSAKYEFNAKIKIKNETAEGKNAMNLYPDGKELRSDVPAVLSLAGSYDIIPALKFSLTYIHHFEPQATLESWDGAQIVKRQDLIDHGTNEYMAGFEWKLSKKFLVSTGCQWSDVGVKDTWQNDITHNLDNFTLGLGAAYHINYNLTLNIGGLYTWYNPVSIGGTAAIQGTAVSLPYTQTFDRSNKALSIGIDYRF